MPKSTARQSPDTRILKYTAPVLLTLLACIQLVLGLRFDLTPWKGGGFGMFSTIDNTQSRMVHVYLETSDGEIPTRVPSWLRNRRKRAKSFPAGFRIESLATRLAAATWVYRGGDAAAAGHASAEAEHGDRSERSRSAAEERADEFPRAKALRPGLDFEDRELVAVDAVRVEVWRLRFDAESGELSQQRIARARAEVPPR